MALISVDEALARILARTCRLDSQTVNLEQAGGQILAHPVMAKLTQPPFAASAMDGYALCARAIPEKWEPVFGQELRPDKELEQMERSKNRDFCSKADEIQAGTQFALIGEAAAGQLFNGQIGSGECVRIFTGAPIPVGADTVVIQEETCLREKQLVEITCATQKGKNIRPLGGDFKEQNEVLSSGQHLTPARLALAAAAGYDRLAIIPKPKVGILSTGDELVKVGGKPKAGQIIASNGVALAEIVRLHGGEVVDLGLVGDNHGALAAALERAKTAQLDILVTSGGASVGDYDLVQQALKAAQMQLDFWKIAMRPGKPLMFGLLPVDKHQNAHNILVLGLPGNPVSSIVTAHLFLVPMLEKLQGKPHSFKLTDARLKTPLKKNGPRRHYLRGTMKQRSNGEIWVEAAASVDSSLLSVLAQANCLIVQEAGAEKQAAGEPCQIFIPPFGL